MAYKPNGRTGPEIDRLISEQTLMHAIRRNTKGRTITESQVRQLVGPDGVAVLTGTLTACQLAAQRRGWVVGVDCMINNVWSL